DLVLDDQGDLAPGAVAGGNQERGERDVPEGAVRGDRQALFRDPAEDRPDEHPAQRREILAPLGRPFREVGAELFMNPVRERLDLRLSGQLEAGDRVRSHQPENAVRLGEEVLQEDGLAVQDLALDLGEIDLLLPQAGTRAARLRSKDEEPAGARPIADFEGGDVEPRRRVFPVQLQEGLDIILAGLLLYGKEGPGVPESLRRADRGD